MDAALGATVTRINLLLFAGRVELLEIGPEIVPFFCVVDTSKRHLGSGNLCARVGDVFLEGRLVPCDAGVLVGIRVIVVLDRARLSTIEAVKHGAYLVLGVHSDRMAG